MSFSILWHPKAAKFVEDLPKGLGVRVLKKFDQLAESPFHYLEHFEGDGFKFRIGEYRAIIDVNIKTKVIKIKVFDKRERIYDQL